MLKREITRHRNLIKIFEEDGAFHQSNYHKGATIALIKVFVKIEKLTRLEENRK